ncbi:MAG: hypothetical protein ACD_5C00114G0003 [uncultured bacterium]|nr:MAG: hypothetical protein ACD_5C00114G0003 [uncultured bacterium]
MKQIESFFWGIVAALGALFLQLIIFIGSSILFEGNKEISFDAISLIPAFIISFAFIEEIFKYIVISKMVESYSLHRSFIVNSLFIGLGFAFTEFLLLSSVGNLPDRKILAELATVHIGTSGLIGYLIAIKNPNKIKTFIWITFLATFFHAGYNSLITQREFVQNYMILALLAFLVFYNILNLFRIESKLAQE